MSGVSPYGCVFSRGGKTSCVPNVRYNPRGRQGRLLLSHELEDNLRTMGGM